MIDQGRKSRACGFDSNLELFSTYLELFSLPHDTGIDWREFN
jgi:hypothetical protein